MRGRTDRTRGGWRLVSAAGAMGLALAWSGDARAQGTGVAAGAPRGQILARGALRTTRDISSLIPGGLRPTPNWRGPVLEPTYPPGVPICRPVCPPRRDESGCRASGRYGDGIFLDASYRGSKFGVDLHVGSTLGLERRALVPVYGLGYGYGVLVDDSPVAPPSPVGQNPRALKDLVPAEGEAKFAAGATLYDERTLASLTPEERARLALPIGGQIRRDEAQKALREAGWVDGKPPAELTALERAASAMGQGRSKDAVEALRAHIRGIKPAEPEAPPAGETEEMRGERERRQAEGARLSRIESAGMMRVLALALYEDGQDEEASAVVRQAYRQDPDLAERAMDVSPWGVSEERVRGALRRASVSANRTKSASAWLGVAVLMQAERRFVPALQMLGRAEKEGLEAEIASPLRTALERSIKSQRAR